MSEKQPLDVFFLMETGDPDDIITLVMMIAHSRFSLHGVSIFPGGTDQGKLSQVTKISLVQVGFVKGVLSHLNINIPVGSCREEIKLDKNKQYLSVGLPRLFPMIKLERKNPDG